MLSARWLPVALAALVVACRWRGGEAAEWEDISCPGPNQTTPCSYTNTKGADQVGVSTSHLRWLVGWVGAV